MSTTKDEIAELALKLVGRKSFSSFSYDDISRELDLTKAAVHYHFQSKEELGIAVCEALREKLLAARVEELAKARKGRHPWRYLEARFKTLAPGGICPIVSLQADFENLPERLREALTALTATEIENLRLVTRAYDGEADEEAVIALLLSLKGALQYRRVMGERFFKKMVNCVKTQFFALVPDRA